MKTHEFVAEYVNDEMVSGWSTLPFKRADVKMFWVCLCELVPTPVKMNLECRCQRENSVAAS